MLDSDLSRIGLKRRQALYAARVRKKWLCALCITTHSLSSYITRISKLEDSESITLKKDALAFLTVLA